MPLGVLKQLTGRARPRRRQSYRPGGNSIDDLRSMVAEMTDNLVAITTGDHIIRWVNPAFERKLACPDGAAIGMTPMDFAGDVGKASKVALHKRISASLAKTGTFREEIHAQGLDGSAVWFAVDIHEAPSSRNEPVHYLHVWRDISDTVEARAQLEQETARNRLEALVTRNTANSVHATGLDGKISWANDAFRETLGWQEEEVIGRLPADFLVHPDCDPAQVQRLRESRRLGEAFTGELVLNHRTGRAVHMQTEFMPVHDAKGDLEAFVTIYTNITPFKELTGQLAHSEAEAHRLAEAAELTGVAIYFTDGDSNVTWANHAFSKITGFDREEAVGRNIYDLIVSPRTNPQVLSEIKRNKEARQPFGHTVKVRRKNGEDFWFQLDLTPVPRNSSDPGATIVVGRDVTKDLIAAERLQRAELVAGVGNWHVSLPDMKLTWSEGVSRIHGLAPGRTPASVQEAIAYYHPEDRPKITEAFERAVSTGETFEQYLRIITAAGDIRHVYVKAEVELAPGGEPDACFGIIQDVTELEHARRRLGHAEQVARVGHWQLRPGRRVMHWSDEAFRICGMEPGEIAPTRKRFAQLIHPEDRDRFWSWARQAQWSETEYDDTFRIFRTDGEVRHIRLKIEVEPDDKGKARSYFGIVEDVTERMLTARYIARAEAIANIGHWRYSVVSDKSYWSDQSYRIFGFEPGAFEPSIRKTISLYHPDDQQKMKDVVNRNVDGESEFDYVLRIVRTDGAVRFVEVRSEPETDGEGGVIGHFGTIQDVTERIESEHNLVAEKERAVGADKAKADFLATMSHEIRTPLNAIIGFAEVMQAETFGSLGDDRYRDYIASITNSGQHLLALLSDILDLSRIDAQGFEMEEREFCLDKLLGDCAGMMGGAARDQHIALIGDRQHRFRVRADERAVKQVVLNLLSNAIKFTGTGGEITLRTAETEAGGCAISVADTGIGIPEAALLKVFEPFKQGRSAQIAGRGGAGIGLALSKRLIELHGGTITIDSREGEGTTVTATLPADRIVACETAAPDEPDWPGSPAGAKRLMAPAS